MERRLLHTSRNRRLGGNRPLRKRASRPPLLALVFASLAPLAVCSLSCSPLFGSAAPLSRVPEQAASSILSQPALTVVVSIPPQKWLVEELGGARVRTWSLLQPGDSAETYQPSDAEVTRVLQARLFVPIGVPFENGAWAQALRAVSKVETAELVSQSERGAASHGHSEGVDDPHIWLSPRRMIQHAELVASALGSADPEGAPIYAANLEQVRASLTTLDAELRRLLGPWRSAQFLVFHPSWTSFASDYGLRQLAIQRHGKEPSDSELTELLRAARRAGLSTVFVQPEIAGRAAFAIADALAAEVEALDPLAVDLPHNLLASAAALIRSFQAAERRRHAD